MSAIAWEAPSIDESKVAALATAARIRPLTARDVDTARAVKDLSAAEKELAAWHGELDGAHQALVERRGWAQARLDAAARVSSH